MSHPFKRQITIEDLIDRDPRPVAQSARPALPALPNFSIQPQRPGNVYNTTPINNLGYDNSFSISRLDSGNKRPTSGNTIYRPVDTPQQWGHIVNPQVIQQSQMGNKCSGGMSQRPQPVGAPYSNTNNYHVATNNSQHLTTSRNPTANTYHPTTNNHYPTANNHYPTTASQPTPSAALGGFGGARSAPNPHDKYIKVSGIRKLNPAFDEFEKRNNGRGTSVMNPSIALPVVSNMNDHATMCKNMNQDIPLAEATDASIDIFQDPTLCKQIGVSKNAIIDELGRIFAKYEIPIGLMNKLLGLSDTDFDLLEFIVDDSGSMGNASDYNDGSGRVYTRWQEVSMRLKSMIEILAYIPTAPILIHFLNRNVMIRLSHNKESPAEFINNAYAQIDHAFSPDPNHGTPYLEKLEQSFAASRGKRVSRYLFGDGEPNGGEQTIKKIKKLLINRHDPKNNPITLLSCTGDDEQVAWMKELDETASYCAEIDDYHDEYDEVVHDQGEALPFNRGFHLICQLVAAINPEDLDAMDESVPITKYSLDNLLGIVNSIEDYRHYFTHFIIAQKKRDGLTRDDAFKKNWDWSRYFNEFATAQSSTFIPAVQDFHRHLTPGRGLRPLHPRCVRCRKGFKQKIKFFIFYLTHRGCRGFTPC